MNLPVVAPARTGDAPQIRYWHERLVGAGQVEPRYDHRSVREVVPPLARRINDFISCHRPDAICDRCICKALDFHSIGQIASIVEALGTTSDFDRRPGKCILCENEAIVVRTERAVQI
jgi:hypothetical protein